MPKVEDVMPFMSFTDHHIRIHKSESARSPPMSPRVRAIAGLLALLAIVAGLAVAIATRGRISPAGKLATETLAAGRLDEARALIERWALSEPRNGEPEYHRAVLEVEADRPTEALDAMRRAIARGVPEARLLVLRAVLLARAGQFPAAEPELVRAERAGEGPPALVAEGLSRIYLKTFRLPETIRALEAWKLAAPDDPRPYLFRNEVDERINVEPGAIVRNYREALRRDPSLLGARLGLAETLRKAALLDEAATEYEGLLALDPKNAKGQVGAGQVALLQGDLVAASRHFEAALAIDPRDKVALREVGLIEMNAGKLASARDRFAAAVAVDPYDPEVRYSYSRALRMSGQGARADEEAAATERLKKDQQHVLDLRQTLVEHPEDADTRSEVARWLIEHGHETEGLEWTRLTLQKNPGHRPTCQLLVDYYARHGNPGLANYYRMAASPPLPPD